MNRWGSNSGLLFLSFLMAVGIVWIKGQERLGSKPLNGIPVSVESIPNNLVLPDPWNPPIVSVNLFGPSNVLNIIRPDQCRFIVPFSLNELSDGNTPQNVILNETMFRTSMVDENDRVSVSVSPESIQPRQASFYLLSWDITKERPGYENLIAPDSLTIPLYRIERTVPIVAPSVGTPPNGYKLKDIVVDPPEILLTGPRAAVDRIRAITTATFDLTYVSPQTPPQYMTLPDLEENFSVWPVAKNIRGVTVSFKLTK